MRCKIIPDAQRSAIAMTTFPISFLPSLALAVSHPEDATITPPTRIPPKQIKRINVVIILVSAHINTGNAVTSVTTVVSVLLGSVPNLIHFPTNGTFVLSLIPQQTHGSLQFSHAQVVHLELFH